MALQPDHQSRTTILIPRVICDQHNRSVLYEYDIFQCPFQQIQLEFGCIKVYIINMCFSAEKTKMKELASVFSVLLYPGEKSKSSSVVT